MAKPKTVSRNMAALVHESLDPSQITIELSLMARNLLNNAHNVYSITDGPPEKLESVILEFDFDLDYTVDDKVGWFVLLFSAANRDAKKAKDAMSRSKYLISV